MVAGASLFPSEDPSEKPLEKAGENLSSPQDCRDLELCIVFSRLTKMDMLESCLQSSMAAPLRETCGLGRKQNASFSHFS